MSVRNLVLPLCALLAGAAGDPPPPAQLEPYIEDGSLVPGEYAWARGRFADASDQVPRRAKPVAMR